MATFEGPRDFQMYLKLLEECWNRQDRAVNEYDLVFWKQSVSCQHADFCKKGNASLPLTAAVFCLSRFRQQFVPAVGLACLYRRPLYFCRKLVSDSRRCISIEPLLLRQAKLLFWTLPHDKSSLRRRAELGGVTSSDWVSGHSNMQGGHSIGVWNSPSLCGRSWHLVYYASLRKKLLYGIPCGFEAVPWQSSSLHFSLLEAECLS